MKCSFIHQIEIILLNTSCSYKICVMFLASWSELAPLAFVALADNLEGPVVGWCSHRAEVDLLIVGVLVVCGVYPGSWLARSPEVAQLPPPVPGLVVGRAPLLPFLAAGSMFVVVAECACGSWVRLGADPTQAASVFLGLSLLFYSSSFLPLW